MATWASVLLVLAVAQVVAVSHLARRRLERKPYGAIDVVNSVSTALGLLPVLGRVIGWW